MEPIQKPLEDKKKPFSYNITMLGNHGPTNFTEFDEQGKPIGFVDFNTPGTNSFYTFDEKGEKVIDEERTKQYLDELSSSMFPGRTDKKIKSVKPSEATSGVVLEFEDGTKIDTLDMSPQNAPILNQFYNSRNQLQKRYSKEPLKNKIFTFQKRRTTSRLKNRSENDFNFDYYESDENTITQFQTDIYEKDKIFEKMKIFSNTYNEKISKMLGDYASDNNISPSDLEDALYGIKIVDYNKKTGRMKSTISKLGSAIMDDSYVLMEFDDDGKITNYQKFNNGYSKIFGKKYREQKEFRRQKLISNPIRQKLIGNPDTIKQSILKQVQLAFSKVEEPGNYDILSVGKDFYKNVVKNILYAYLPLKNRSNDIKVSVAKGRWSTNGYVQTNNDVKQFKSVLFEKVSLNKDTKEFSDNYGILNTLVHETVHLLNDLSPYEINSSDYANSMYGANESKNLSMEFFTVAAADVLTDFLVENGVADLMGNKNRYNKYSNRSYSHVFNKMLPIMKKIGFLEKNNIKSAKDLGNLYLQRVSEGKGFDFLDFYEELGNPTYGEREFDLDLLSNNEIEYEYVKPFFNNGKMREWATVNNSENIWKFVDDYLMSFSNTYKYYYSMHKNQFVAYIKQLFSEDYKNYRTVENWKLSVRQKLNNTIATQLTNSMIKELFRSMIESQIFGGNV